MASAVPDPAVPAVPTEEAADAAGGADGGKKKKGKGRGRGGWWQVHRPHVVPESFEVNEEMRYSGTVSFYSRPQGYGFIKLATPDIVPEDRIFVHWRSITSEDRFPFLLQEMEVELNVQKWKEWGLKGKVSLRAKNVSLPGGKLVALQEAKDKEEKAFLVSLETRYKGDLKFYDPRKGFGYITLAKPEGDASEILVDRAEINCGTEAPKWMESMPVEFGMYKTDKGQLRAYNMTHPGGNPLTLATLEKRESQGESKYKGSVTIWNPKQGWGFIKCDPTLPLPALVSTKLDEQAKTAKDKAEAKGQDVTEGKEALLYFRREDCKEGVRVQKDSEVMFQVYTDTKGAGACDIELI